MCAILPNRTDIRTDFCFVAARILESLTDSLAPARLRASSRLSPPPTPATSAVIHLVVLAAWIALFACVFGFADVWAWAIGLAYLGYDLALQIFTAWQIRTIVRGPPAPFVADEPATRPALAVLIAAHNEATVLPATLAALLGSHDPPDEIVIADDGSDDGTAAYLSGELAVPIPAPGDVSVRAVVGATSVIWLRLPHGGKAAALNRALVATDAEIVLTIDADTLPASDAIGVVRQAFSREPQLVGVTGIITPVCRRTPFGQVMQWFQSYEYIRNFLARYAWMRIDCLQLISGAFAGFRRQAVVDVGGFDDSCLVEDYEVVARMQRYAGDHAMVWRFRVLGDAQAHTEAPSTLAAFLRQRRRWFGGFLQTQFWYRAMVGSRRYGRLGTVMLPVKALDTVQPLYGLTAFALLVCLIGLGQHSVVGPVLAVVAGKLMIDIVFQVWSLRVYRQWVGDGRRASLAGAAISGLIQPFTFQILLQLGGLLGWIAFVTGAGRWGGQTRYGVSAPSD